MRKKITYIATAAAIFCAAFFIGRNTAYDLDTDAGFKAACDLMGNIVDWNTNGKELAIMTDDGYEFYAYQSENIYRNRLFVPVESEE